MSAVGVDVHFGRDFGILQREEIDGGVFHMHGIVFRLNNDSRRSFFRDVNLGIRSEVLFCQCEVAGIDNDGKIRPATDFIRVIHRVIQTLLEVRAERRRKMGPGRESERPDAIRIVRSRVRVAHPAARRMISYKAPSRARDTSPECM